MIFPHDNVSEFQELCSVEWLGNIVPNRGWSWIEDNRYLVRLDFIFNKEISDINILDWFTSWDLHYFFSYSCALVILMNCGQKKLHYYGFRKFIIHMNCLNTSLTTTSSDSVKLRVWRFFLALELDMLPPPIVMVALVWLFKSRGVACDTSILHFINIKLLTDKIGIISNIDCR